MINSKNSQYKKQYNPYILKQEFTGWLNKLKFTIQHRKGNMLDRLLNAIQDDWGSPYGYSQKFFTNHFIEKYANQDNKDKRVFPTGELCIGDSSINESTIMESIPMWGGMYFVVCENEFHYNDFYKRKLLDYLYPRKFTRKLMHMLTEQNKQMEICYMNYVANDKSALRDEVYDLYMYLRGYKVKRFRDSILGNYKYCENLTIFWVRTTSYYDSRYYRALYELKSKYGAMPFANV